MDKKSVCPHCKLDVAEDATRCPHCQGTISRRNVASDMKMVLILLVLIPVIAVIYSVHASQTPAYVPPPQIERALTDEQCKRVLDAFLEKPIEAKIYPQISKIQQELSVQYISHLKTGIHYTLPTTECGKNLSAYFETVNYLNKAQKTLGQ